MHVTEKVKISKHEPHYKLRVSSCVPEGQVVPVPLLEMPPSDIDHFRRLTL